MMVTMNFRPELPPRRSAANDDGITAAAAPMGEAALAPPLETGDQGIIPMPEPLVPQHQTGPVFYDNPAIFAMPEPLVPAPQYSLLAPVVYYVEDPAAAAAMYYGTPVDPSPVGSYIATAPLQQPLQYQVPVSHASDFPPASTFAMLTPPSPTTAGAYSAAPLLPPMVATAPPRRSSAIDVITLPTTVHVTGESTLMRQRPPRTPDACTVDSDREFIRAPIYWTLPFVLKIVTLLASLVGVIAIRVALPAARDIQDPAAAATGDETGFPVLLAYQWLMVTSIGYCVGYLVVYGGCFYNRQARKIKNASATRQAWKLNARRCIVAPVDAAFVLVWLVECLVLAFATGKPALYHAACSITASSSDAAATEAHETVGVTCTLATTVLAIGGIVGGLWLVSCLHVGWAISKNRAKVAKLDGPRLVEEHHEPPVPITPIQSQQSTPKPPRRGR
ncbi:hypothetical protein BC828DRAFT_390310 [Blastocladiella britannica]|nr:hypothetical protein BC828DRAFT_390310 [Blastocladiella britannica]